MHATDVPTSDMSPKVKPTSGMASSRLSGSPSNLSLFGTSAQNVVPFTVKKRNLFSANYPINCLRFSPDGYQIACGSSGGVAR